jgi:hypothetical protein
VTGAILIIISGITEYIEVVPEQASHESVDGTRGEDLFWTMGVNP